MDYIPQTIPQPQPSQPSQPTYELKKDVTGKPPEKRGPQELTAIRMDRDGKQVKFQFKVPYPPKSKCKKCYGRGYIGFDAHTGNVFPCRKCYPLK